MPLLAALGLELTSWPVYLTNLCFELWRKEDGQHVVRRQQGKGWLEGQGEEAGGEGGTARVPHQPAL